MTQGTYVRIENDLKFREESPGKGHLSVVNLIVFAQCLWCFLDSLVESITTGNFNRDHFGWIIAWQEGFFTLIPSSCQSLTVTTWNSSDSIHQHVRQEMLGIRSVSPQP